MLADILCPGVCADSNSLSVLRTARLLRVFKLARSWAELNRIITTILRSFGQVVYLSMLLVLFMFVFALMVRQSVEPANSNRTAVALQQWSASWPPA